jgi:methanogenic corrinoid protein MtbC1
VAPFEDFALTHTLCDACVNSDAVLDESRAGQMVPIRNFLEKVARAGEAAPASATALVEEGLRLGLAPVDLLMGVLQPVLYRMGVRWSEAVAGIHEEHRLTSVCATMIQLLAERQRAEFGARQSPAPAVLLVNAEGNFHTLGVQIVEFYLLAHGVPVFTVHPGLPARQVLALALSLRPKVIGVSVALPTQLASVRELAEELAQLSAAERPRLVAGGYGVRQLSDPGRDFGFSLAQGPAEILALLRAG